MSKILIIDDEEPILNMYGEALRGQHEVIFANNGETGLETAQKEHPDLILLDIIMPKFNGLDVLERLRSNNDTADIPVLMLTNLPQEASGDKAKQLGAKGYFVKAEYEPDKLAKVVQELING